jgi:hypothetical protein
LISTQSLFEIWDPFLSARAAGNCRISLRERTSAVPDGTNSCSNAISGLHQIGVTVIDLGQDKVFPTSTDLR